MPVVDNKEGLSDLAERMFDNLDHDSDGNLTRASLEKAVRLRGGLLLRKCDDIFEGIDTDQSGTISKSEFVESMIKALYDNDGGSSVGESGMGEESKEMGEQQTDVMDGATRAMPEALPVCQTRPKITTDTTVTSSLSNLVEGLGCGPIQDENNSTSTLPSERSVTRLPDDRDQPRVDRPQSPASKDSAASDRSGLSNLTMLSGEWYIRSEITRDLSTFSAPRRSSYAGADDPSTFNHIHASKSHCLTSRAARPRRRASTTSEQSYLVDTISSGSTRNVTRDHQSHRLQHGYRSARDAAEDLLQKLQHQKHEAKLLSQRVSSLGHQCGRLEAANTALAKNEASLQEQTETLKKDLSAAKEALAEARQTVANQKDRILAAASESSFRFAQLQSQADRQSDSKSRLLHEMHELRMVNTRLQESLLATREAETRRIRQTRAFATARHFTWKCANLSQRRKIKWLEEQLLTARKEMNRLERATHNVTVRGGFKTPTKAIHTVTADANLSNGIHTHTLASDLRPFPSARPMASIAHNRGASSNRMPLAEPSRAKGTVVSDGNAITWSKERRMIPHLQVHSSDRHNSVRQSTGTALVESKVATCINIGINGSLGDTRVPTEQHKGFWSRWKFWLLLGSSGFSVAGMALVCLWTWRFRSVVRSGTRAARRGTAFSSASSAAYAAAGIGSMLDFEM